MSQIANPQHQISLDSFCESIGFKPLQYDEMKKLIDYSEDIHHAKLSSISYAGPDAFFDFYTYQHVFKSDIKYPDLMKLCKFSLTMKLPVIYPNGEVLHKDYTTVFN